MVSKSEKNYIDNNFKNRSELKWYIYIYISRLRTVWSGDGSVVIPSLERSPVSLRLAAPRTVICQGLLANRLQEPWRGAHLAQVGIGISNLGIYITSLYQLATQLA